MDRPLLSLISLVILAGCATPSQQQRRPNPELVRVVAMAAAQVQRCYRMPRLPREGRQITIVLRVRYGPDGALIGLPEVKAQRGVTPENATYANRMAEAATLAVIRCSPLSLPPQYHQGGWDDFELTFSPRAVA